MALDFTDTDVRHSIMAKFVRATLPDAEKPYRLKAVMSPVLDIHEVASKADVYNIETDPKVIEEGFNAASRLIHYLSADGCRVKTDLFNTHFRFPGGYDGGETALSEGMLPQVRVRPARSFRRYVAANCTVRIDGIEDENGRIGSALDAKTGEVNGAATIGNLLTIRGRGLKIGGDEAHQAQVGVFFQSAGHTVRAELIAVNQSRALRIIVPALTPGAGYTLRICTQRSARDSPALLKNIREMRSEFSLTARE
ncbi:MAG: DUF4469 domain-containing protein [Treponema sp.]|jgi:hypothetical protein|nr:DUF4469 domain-containing protein [Treponema sp.]